jgi:hypothetical protein
MPSSVQQPYAPQEVGEKVLQRKHTIIFSIIFCFDFSSEAVIGKSGNFLAGKTILGTGINAFTAGNLKAGCN